MNSTEIQAAIDKAKCCLGDIGCRILSKANGGSPYHYTLIQAEKIKLYIFCLESYLSLSCTTVITDLQLSYIRDQINTLCVSCTGGSLATDIDFSSLDFDSIDFH
jgi:hypothetical protein